MSGLYTLAACTTFDPSTALPASGVGGIEEVTKRLTFIAHWVGESEGAFVLVDTISGIRDANLTGEHINQPNWDGEIVLHL